MKFPLGWISEYVDLPEDAKAVAEAFTLSGSEVESVEEVSGEAVFDFGITVNRPDCMNVFGLAREGGVLFSRSLAEPEIEVNETGEEIGSLASVKVEAPDLCPRYAARVITGVKVGESPGWMQRRLELCGLRPVNAVVDITNYVLLELGHPLHAFDMARVRGGSIIVRRAKNGETLVTLDGEQRKLDPERLVIADPEKPLALAGIMGGEASGVTEDTSDILLEGAVFDPVNIRRSTKAVNLNTDASHRFERGVDYNGATIALDRTAHLIADICGGSIAVGILDVTGERPDPAAITLRHDRLEKVLGMEVTHEKCPAILESLGFKVIEKSRGVWNATPPSFRVDVFREIDLIEEIARIYGYTDLQPALPQVIDPVGGVPESIRFEERLRDELSASGCLEAIHMSMSDPGIERAFDGESEMVDLANPLSPATSVMRCTLIGRLAATAAWNRSHGQRNVRLFELGKVFRKGDEGGIREESRLGALCYSDDPRVEWGDPAECTLLHLKGKIENTFEKLGVQISFKAAEVPGCISGLGLGIYFGSEKSGWMGTLDGKAMSAAGFKGGIAHGCEISLEGVTDLASPPKFKPVSRYPSIKRDMAFLVDKGVKWDEVRASIEGLDLPNLEALKLIELYEGPKVPEMKKSFTFSVSFRSDSRTLKEEEVVSSLDRISGMVEQEYKASRR